MNNLEKILGIYYELDNDIRLIQNINFKKRYYIRDKNEQLTIYKDATNKIVDFIFPDTILILNETLFEEFLKYFYINMFQYSIEEYCRLMNFDKTQTILELLKYD
jgi:hypothetical protein